MPPWPQPCRSSSTQANGAGGATKFDYNGSGSYAVLSMDIEATWSGCSTACWRHEVTHTSYADHFR